ncbi:hypothetical protein LJR090_004721 [Bosea sp. LjRoot90]|uniref:hypothetical protein n=1 Tax=Bosea sp. LjRoot90 TaxID=3342342 RepID=UPI003ECC3C77
MSEKTDDLKILKDISVEWFKIHADQRLKAFNFFIIISGFLFTAYFAALSQKNRPACIFVGVMIISVCFVFKLLDMRTSQLLKLSEAAVSEVLSRIEIDSDHKNLIGKSNQRGCTPSYRQSFNALFLLFAIAGALGVMYSLVWDKL